MNYTDLLTSGMLGDKYVDPRRRISRQLYKSGADTSPIAHPMQGYARLAQTLAGMYGDKMMFDERGRTADAFNRAQPESFRPGDVENDEALLERFMQDPEAQAWLEQQGEDGTVEGGLKTFQGTPARTDTYDAARAKELPGLEGQTLDQYLPESLVSAPADFNPTMQGMGIDETDITESGLPISPDFDPNELFETLRAQSRGPDVSTQRPDIDWKIQQLLAEGNPGSRNLAMRLQMMKMDRQAAAGLKKSERAETLSDLELGHGYAKELAQMRIDAKDPRTPKMKDFEMAKNDPIYKEFLQQEGGDENRAIQKYKFYRTLKTDAEKRDWVISQRSPPPPRDIGGSVIFPNLADPGGPPISEIQKTPTPQSMPGFQADVEAAKVTAKKKAEAEWDAPKAKLEMDRMMGVLDQIYKLDDQGELTFTHPGFESLIGATPIPFRRYVHGTQTYSLDQIVEQVKSKNFLMAFQQLKGGGHITEVEGDKATAAIAAIQVGMREDAFIIEMEKVKDVLRTGYENLRRQAGLIQPDITLQKGAGDRRGPSQERRGQGPNYQEKLELMRKIEALENKKAGR